MSIGIGLDNNSIPDKDDYQFNSAPVSIETIHIERKHKNTAKKSKLPTRKISPNKKAYE